MRCGEYKQAVFQIGLRLLLGSIQRLPVCIQRLPAEWIVSAGRWGGHGIPTV
jgi:hypothetical protein